MKVKSLFPVIGLVFLAGGCFAAGAFAYEVGDVVMVDPFGGNKDFESAQVLVKEARGYQIRLLPGNKHSGEYFVPESWISGKGAAPASVAPGAAASVAPGATSTMTGAASIAAPHTTSKSQPSQWQGAANDPYRKMFNDINEQIRQSKNESTGSPAAPAGPVTGSHPFEGLYLRHEQSWQGTALSYREDHYYFFSDGRVYHGVPPEGPGRFNWAKEQQTHPQRCGQYGVNGNKITFSYSGTAPYTWPIRMKSGQEMELNMSPTVKVDKFGANAKLSGSYHRGTVFGSNYSIGAAPTIAKAGIYNFSPNGTVTTDSTKGIGGDTNDTGVTASIYQKNAGTYSVSGNDMTISLAGETMHCTAYPIMEGGQPIRISINGALFERKR
ncbi:MAG: lipocalin family protein [Candidatus Obscuribacterales bacterium]|nr:lipocalin family protein [Candidatus Obscuribacterales bacterium]